MLLHLGDRSWLPGAVETSHYTCSNLFGKVLARLKQLLDTHTPCYGTHF